MDAWETLIAGSTIASGDAWEHLHAQGGGGAGTVILAVGLDGVLTTADISASVVDQALLGVVTVPVLTATITVEALSAEIQDVSLTSDIIAMEFEGEV